MFEAITFLVVGFVMLITHEVADHWVQTSWQAGHKGLHGDKKWTGRVACAKHVASYTLCTAFAVGSMWYVFALQMSWLGFVLGQAVSAVTHYWADQRSTLMGLAGRLGLAGFYRLGAPRTGQDKNGHERDDNPTLGTGAYALDQSWHKLWILIAALISAIVA
ncbi:DUF3307 domain-containing protein [Actinomadura sp. KC345]|uniref:DUF3307 domain-containing protein n=1 Tax=Actinomadura sp. KC345 TaxID=2530371 RepID=UPI001A9F5A42|nr:DUF3307 domain-containing protein [Actinomadura sp. KC345]